MLVVDPRQHRDRPLQFERPGIVPDRDASLLLSLLAVMFADGLVDTARVSGRADGIGWLRTLCQLFSRRRP